MMRFLRWTGAALAAALLAACGGGKDGEAGQPRFPVPTSPPAPVTPPAAVPTGPEGPAASFAQQCAPANEAA